MDINLQIREVEAELRRRKSAYPKRIEAGQMTTEQAAYGIAAMQAVYETLTQLRGLVARTT